MSNNDIDQQIKELQAKYQVKDEQPKEEVKEQQQEESVNPYLEYLNKKYGNIQFPADIQLQNNLLYAIFCELVEIKTGNDEAREFIMSKGK